MIAVMGYTLREANLSASAVPAKLPDPSQSKRHPWGDGSTQPGLQNLHTSVNAQIRTRHSPPQGEAMAQQYRGPGRTPQAGHPERERARPPLTMLAGRRGGSGELGFRFVPLAQVRS